MLIQDNSRSSDVSCLFDPPKSDILLSTTHHFEIVNRAEFETQNVEVGCLFGEDIWLLSAVDARDIPDDNHLLIV